MSYFLKAAYILHQIEWQKRKTTTIVSWVTIFFFFSMCKEVSQRTKKTISEEKEPYNMSVLTVFSAMCFFVLFFRLIKRYIIVSIYMNYEIILLKSYCVCVFILDRKDPNKKINNILFIRKLNLAAMMLLLYMHK